MFTYFLLTGFTALGSSLFDTLYIIKNTDYNKKKTVILKMMVGNIEVFDPANGNWKSYIERLEQYIILNDIKEHLKVPTLITLMGGTAYELLATLCAPQKPSTMTYNEVVKTMSDHLYPKPCILAERYKFRQRKQYNGETISEYAIELRKLAMKCNYNTSLDENLTDQLVFGLQCETTRQRLFVEDECDFRTALAIAHRLEATEGPSTKYDYDDELLMSRSDFKAALAIEHGLDMSEGQSSESYNEAQDPMSCSNESEAEDEGTLKKKQRKNKHWTFVKKFVNLKEAEEFLTAEDSWSWAFTRITKEGLKRYYRCNKVKKKGPQCATELFLLFLTESDDILVYRTDSDHNHDEIGTRGNYGIPNKTKKAIDNLFDQHLKPRDILFALGKINGIKLPTKKQLSNYLADKKRPKFKKTPYNLSKSKKGTQDFPHK